MKIVMVELILFAIIFSQTSILCQRTYLDSVLVLLIQRRERNGGVVFWRITIPGKLFEN